MFNTALKQKVSELEQQLGEKNALLNAIGRSMAVIEFGLDGIILDANDNFLRLMGYTAQELRGAHHRIFCEPEYVASREYGEFWQKLGRGEYTSGQYLRITRGGSPVWLEATYNPVFNAQGQPCRIIKLANDITPRVLADQENAGKLQALNRSMAVIEFAMDGTVLSANDNFLRTMGYRMDDLRGKHHRIFCEQSYVRSPEYAAFWADLNRGEFASGQFRRLTRDGRAVWMEATYNPVFDAQGKPSKVVKFANDISERVERYEAEAESARMAYHVSLETETLSAEGDRVIREAAAEMDRVAETVQVSSRLLEELDTRSGEIDFIVRTIHEIADQTNLLSLNAAIEAARAGEHGRGFAVVADEVRKLAERTGSSTGRISEITRAIQDSTKAAIERMGDTARQADRGAELTNEVGTTISKIHDGAKEVVRVVGQLSSIRESSAGH